MSFSSAASYRVNDKGRLYQSWYQKTESKNSVFMLGFLPQAVWQQLGIQLWQEVGKGHMSASSMLASFWIGELPTIDCMEQKFK